MDPSKTEEVEVLRGWVAKGLVFLPEEGLVASTGTLGVISAFILADESLLLTSIFVFV